MRLADFIVQNMSSLLADWESFARTVEPAAFKMDATALRNHVCQMLQTVADDLRRPQSAHEQAEKSKGRAPEIETETAAESHAAARLCSGYTMGQMVSEYRALRASVLRQWSDSVRTPLTTDAVDITRFNEAIDQLIAESVSRFAKRVEQSQNMFLAILAHDLQNPLSTTITGAEYIMKAQDLALTYRSVATQIHRSSRRMSKLVDDLICFTRTHFGSTLPLSPQPVNLTDIAFDIVEELRVSHGAQKIKFSANDAFYAMGDASRVAQILSNLLGNALQYGSKNDPIELCLAAENTDIVLTVWNAGPPIPPSRMQFVFEPLMRFVQEGSTDTRADKSLGIGLYIAREIVLAHGGSIDVSSFEQAGTTFTIRMPRLEALDVVKQSVSRC